MADEPQTDVPTPVALTIAEQRASEFEAKWKRALADYQNRERDIAREREEFAKFCAAGLIRDILPLGDALRAAGESHAELRKLLDDVLKRYGVEAIGTIGERVDYLLHEVIETRTEASIAAGTVLEVPQTGYTMHGRLLRPASVIISAEPSKNL